MNILVTEDAIQELRANKEQDVQYFRIGVLPGGCSGFKYSLALEPEAAEDDFIVDVSDDVKIIVDPFSGQYLDGVELGFMKTLTEAGFTFKNPNATGKCGCGTSFSA